MGMPRSGSSWTYTICRNLVRLKYGDKFAPPKRYHGYRDPGRNVAFATYRDPRDSLISLAKVRKMRGGHGDLNACFKHVMENEVAKSLHYNINPCIADPRVTAIRYEDFFPDKLAPLICLLAGKLGIETDDVVRNELLETFSLEKNKTRTDQLSFITNNGEYGAWRRDMTPEMLDAARWFLEPAVLYLDYEADNKWMEVVYGNRNA